MSRNPEHALSFGQAAGDYERGRPGYPDAAVDWMLARAAGASHARIAVVDIGAGTGKFTASLVSRGLEVTAVEPDAKMLERLVLTFPTVTALAGSAEAIPLPDSSADLITFAQAWHWVDVATASAEVARVLRPGGALALVWNTRDATVDWVARLGDVMGTSEAERYDSEHPTVGPPLRIDDYAEFGWEHRVSRDELIAMVTSRSYVITMDAAARARLLAALDELLDTHPALAGRDSYAVPYLTQVSIVRVGSRQARPA